MRADHSVRVLIADDQLLFAEALAGALDVGRELGPGGLILVSLSGRGDKDVDTASKWFGV